LFLYIEKALLDNHIQIEDVDGFACVTGPGSFTGIRVGMSVIKGFNKVLKRSIVSLNAFEILLPCLKSGYILLNSTVTSCYYAKVSKHQIVETGVLNKSEISDLAEKNEIIVLKEEQDDIGVEYNNCKVISNLTELYCSSVMNKLNLGEYGEFVPFYLQLSQAERNLSNE